MFSSVKSLCTVRGLEWDSSVTLVQHKEIFQLKTLKGKHLAKFLAIPL